jgi:hypothetical protein
MGHGRAALIYGSSSGPIQTRKEAGTTGQEALTGFPVCPVVVQVSGIVSGECPVLILKVSGLVSDPCPVHMPEIAFPDRTVFDLSDRTARVDEQGSVRIWIAI